MLNNKLSKVIDTMRLPLIFMVVIAHLVPFTLPEVSFDLSGNNIYKLISELFSHHVAKLSVRCYFLVSGYYFFTHYSGDLKSFLKRQYKSRFKTLVIPYLIWNIITVIAILSKNKIFVFMGLQYDEIYPGIMSSNLYKILWDTFCWWELYLKFLFLVLEVACTIIKKLSIRRQVKSITWKK